MEKPFEAHAWAPSRPYEPGETPMSEGEVNALTDLLSRETGTVQRHPYDPSSWLRRGRTLAALRYPELAAGDAHKASLLCQSMLEHIMARRRGWRVGKRMGFWMYDPDAIMDEDANLEYERQRDYLRCLQQQAEAMLEQNLYLYPEQDEGLCVLRQYPWMEERHTFRSDELVELLNQEFSDPKHRKGGEPCCVLQRYAFGKGVGARDGADLLGVFASRDISKGEAILVDTSRTWGCNGPGKDGSTANLGGGMGCAHPLHPNLKGEPLTYDLRWIRDRHGKRAVEAIVKVRFLLCAIEDGVSHPLDHHLLASLTPTYRKDKFKRFSLDRDIAVLNMALQEFGIDIFANLNWDTWVFFVLMARVANNSWSDPITGAVNQLFSLFNHSCEDNIKWQIPKDHRTMEMWAMRDVSRGEQLFVNYNGFMAEQPLAKRRDVFWRWLDGPCQCSRCLREEAEEAEKAEKAKNAEWSPDSSFSSESCGDWDTDPKPVFPEDEIQLESRLFRWQD